MDVTPQQRSSGDVQHFVDRADQRQGIGRTLIRLTHDAAGLHTTLILLAAPLAREYYPHIGMQAHDSCWIIPRRPR